MKGFILVTGVSSGIGEGLAEHYLSKGYAVIGTVRNPNDGLVLEKNNQFYKIVYDVTDKAGIGSFAAKVASILGGSKLFALINNAGIAVAGPMELVNDEDFEKQIDINVHSVRRITNALLPYMGDGSRIIMMSSVSGLFNSPFTGPYCVSKHALESLSDVYRLELALFGIKVVIVEPGPIKTKIWGKAKGTMDKFQDSRYGEFTKKGDKMIENAEKSALEISAVCVACDKGLLLSKPAARYIVHKNAIFFKFLANLVPSSITDSLVAKNLKKGNSHRAI
jgi:NAD(P)-dependent dehydrogenase (short-subunit alcohol dehydrogenase family)